MLVEQRDHAGSDDQSLEKMVNVLIQVPKKLLDCKAHANELLPNGLMPLDAETFCWSLLLRVVKVELLKVPFRGQILPQIWLRIYFYWICRGQDFRAVVL